MKPNFQALKTPQPRRETRTFKEPLQPGAEVTLTLYGMGPLLASQWNTELDRLLREYVTGGMTPEGVRFEKGPVNLPATEAVDAKALWLEASLCETLAAIAVMQPDDLPEEERYTLIDLCYVIDRMPNAWRHIALWVTGLTIKAYEPPEEPGGNGKGAAPPASVASPATSS